MEIKLTTEKIVRETKTIDIELPFFYNWRSGYSCDSDSLYDMQVNVWGIIYLANDDDNEDVIRTTRFTETIREYYDHDKSQAKYDIESEVLDDYSQRKNLGDWLKHQCTEDEFNRNSSIIFKSITNQ